MAAYYNEFDKDAAAWLRELIREGAIAPGDVDERSIEDVVPADLAGYTQCHFFAGIGVWSYALRLAGWSDDRPVWTGSPPCQPFSAAGKGAGVADERHLWPHYFHLIDIWRPDCLFGEQVASKDGLAWLDLVQSDMEGSGYAFGATDLCAAGFGAPHIRQRQFFAGRRAMADPDNSRWEGRRKPTGQRAGEIASGSRSLASGMAFTNDAVRGSDLSGGHVDNRTDTRRSQDSGDVGFGGEIDRNHEPRQTNGHWGTADWLLCRDERWRPVEPGTFPLAHGTAARVGRLRGYGNAIVAQVAEGFVRSFLEAEADGFADLADASPVIDMADLLA